MEESDQLARAYFTDEKGRQTLDKLLASYGIGADAITAKSIADNSAILEQIDQQIQRATARAYALHEKLEKMAERNGHQPSRKLRARRQIAG